MSAFNPNLHRRKSIRLKEHDYSGTGVYFITVCCQAKKCLFGKICNGEMILNEYGTIAHNEWAKLPERFGNIELGEYVVMPNHVHGIIAINPIPTVNTIDDPVGAGLAPAPVINDQLAHKNENGPNASTGATARVAPVDW